jgi:hypothetical protein
LTTKKSEPISEFDKQLLPLAGEIDPREARQKAAMFAAVERIRLKPRASALAAMPPLGKK